MTLWITGAGGMLGKELQAMALAAGHDVLATDRELDIADLEALQTWASAHKFDAVVNCAAYTAVDKAEAEEPLAWRINALGPQCLAKVAAAAGKPMVQISTDYVLDGVDGVPLTEEAPIAPINAYGRTKADGERLVLEAHPGAIIIRTAWLYGIGGPNFVKTMLRLMKEKPALRVVADQFGTPTWTVDLAFTVLQMLGHDKGGGLYHFSGSGMTDWAEFAREIGRGAVAKGILSKEVPVEGIPASAYPTPARRPSWSVLSKDKLAKVYGIVPPQWQESLDRYLDLEKAIVS